MSVELRNPRIAVLVTVALIAIAFLAWYFVGDRPLPVPVEPEKPSPEPRKLPHPAEVRVPATREELAPMPRESRPADPKPAATNGPVPIDEEIQRVMARGLMVERWVRREPHQSPWQLEGSGTLRASHPDGTPMVEGRFVDGKPEGTWTRWHPDGRLLSTVTYVNGVPQGEQVKYHRNGVVAERQTFDGGRAEGQHTTWYENGQIREQGQYQAGQRHGTWRWYDEQGRLLREEQWQNGSRTGPIVMFDVAANPTAEQDRERRASMDGRYSRLLRRIAAPDDRANYGEFHDYGHFQQLADYQGEAAVPAGYWVYVSPYWYIWGERR